MNTDRSKIWTLTWCVISVMDAKRNLWFLTGEMQEKYQVSHRAKVAQMIDVYLETARVLWQFKFSLNKNIDIEIEFMEDKMLKGMRDLGKTCGVCNQQQCKFNMLPFCKTFILLCESVYLSIYNIKAFDQFIFLFDYLYILFWLLIYLAS